MTLNFAPAILRGMARPLCIEFAGGVYHVDGERGQTDPFPRSFGEKQVLFTGEMPAAVNWTTETRLRSLIAGLGESVVDYQQALERLGRLQPDLWLPAVPSNGQNANLYDNEWNEVITRNRRLVGDALLK